MAFRYACFASDPVPCSYDQCGTDEARLMYRTTVQIPTVYPDGIYVLGWAWFGGAVRKSSFFGDYWSCSEVLITGGPRTQSYDPLFRPGENRERVSPEMPQSCYAGVDKLGVCEREPCEQYNATFQKPSLFANGNGPPPIRAYWNRPSRSPSPTRSASQTATENSEYLASKSPYATIFPSGLRGNPQRDGNSEYTSQVPAPSIGPTVMPSPRSHHTNHQRDSPNLSVPTRSPVSYSVPPSPAYTSLAPMPRPPFNNLAQPSVPPTPSAKNTFTTHEPILPTGPSQYQVPYIPSYHTAMASENPVFPTGILLPSAPVLSSNGF